MGLVDTIYFVSTNILPFFDWYNLFIEHMLGKVLTIILFIHGPGSKFRLPNRSPLIRECSKNILQLSHL